MRAQAVSTSGVESSPHLLPGCVEWLTAASCGCCGELAAKAFEVVLMEGGPE
jgi:hypothetical protein